MEWSKYNTLFYSNKIGYCLFNSRMLSLSKMDENTYHILQKVKENPQTAVSLLEQSDYENLCRNKVLVSSNEDNNYLSMLKYKKQIESYTSTTLSMVICPTLSCNFACPYCYEHNLPQTTMSNETQHELVAFINKQTERMKDLTLNWHGGEPLLAFNTIKQIYSLLESESNLPIQHSTMVSNGYLLNEEVCRFLESKHLSYLQITIDGKKETHNKTRVLKNGASSFEKIISNIDMATDLMPHCHIGIRTNIGRGNRNEYAELYKELSNRWKGKNCSVYFSFVLDNGLNTCAERRCAIELNTDEKNSFKDILAKEGVINKKSLFPTLDKGVCTCMDNNAFVVAPDGSIYKCWADVGIKSRSIGSLASGVKNYSIVSQFMEATDKFSDAKCLKCSYLPICNGGCNLYRVGFMEKGIPYNVCEINQEGLVKYLENYCEA